MLLEPVPTEFDTVSSRIDRARERAHVRRVSRSIDVDAFLAAMGLRGKRR